MVLKRYRVVGYGGEGLFHEPFLEEDADGEVVRAIDAMEELKVLREAALEAISVLDACGCTVPGTRRCAYCRLVDAMK